MIEKDYQKKLVKELSKKGILAKHIEDLQKDPGRPDLSADGPSNKHCYVECKVCRRVNWSQQIIKKLFKPAQYPWAIKYIEKTKNTNIYGCIFLDKVKSEKNVVLYRITKEILTDHSLTIEDIVLSGRFKFFLGGCKTVASKLAILMLE